MLSNRQGRFSKITRSYLSFLCGLLNRSIFIFLLLTLPSLSLAQLAFNDVDYHQIPFKKVKPYIERQAIAQTIEHFNELEPSCKNVEDFGTYQVYSRSYTIEQPLSVVWSMYKDSNPTSTWNTKKSKIGLMYLRNEDRLVYPSDSAGSARLGQVIYLNLRMLQGMYNLVTSLEITRLDEDEKTIEFNYVRGGINDGKQVIKLIENSNGQTVLTHMSIVHSESPFRDRVIYPFFHNRLINAFHRNMRRLLELNS